MVPVWAKELQDVYVCVQVCIEELKKVSRDEGVKALPYAQVYKPGYGKLVGLDIPPSKVSAGLSSAEHSSWLLVAD